MPVISRVDSAGANDALRVPEPVAHGAVDVEPVRGEDDARGVARRVALADDEDRVGRVLRREPVGRAERGGVGQGRVAGEQLVVDAERLQGGDRAGRGRPGRGSRGRCRSAVASSADGDSRYHRPPMTDSTDDPPAADGAARPRRLPGPVRLAPRARADRLPRRGARRARRCEQLGARTWDGGPRLPVRQRDGAGDGRPVALRRGASPLLRARRAARARRRPRPTRRRPAEVIAEFADARRRRPDEQPAPAPVRLLHAAAAADVDHGRAPRPGRQPGRRRVARRAVRGVRRGGGRALAVRPRRLRRAGVRAAHERRGHGQLHGA